MRDGTSSRAIERDAYEVLEVRPDASQPVINAAFRALAAVFHPDAAGGTNRRMAELNAAYAQVRSADLRASYDRTRARQRAGASTPRTNGAEPAAGHGQSRDTAKKKGVLDFGRYEGWSIADLSRRDPDYLRWLRRHSSGIRFRNEIDATLASLEPAAVRTPEGRKKRR